MLFVNKRSSVESVDSIKKFCIMWSWLWTTGGLLSKSAKVRPEWTSPHRFALPWCSPTLQPPHTVESCATDLLEPRRTLVHHTQLLVILSEERLSVCFNKQITTILGFGFPGPLSDKPEDGRSLQRDYSLAIDSLTHTETRRCKGPTNVTWFFGGHRTWWQQCKMDFRGKTLCLAFWYWWCGSMIKIISVRIGMSSKNTISENSSGSGRKFRSFDRCIRKTKEQQNSKIHVLPNAGHWLHVDNPQGLIHILIDIWYQINYTNQ